MTTDALVLSPDRHAANYRYGLVLVVASTVAWSVAGLFSRLIHLDAWTMLVWRGLFGGLGLVAVMVLMEGPGALRQFGRLGWAGWAYGLLGAAAMVCFITSLRHTTVAHAAVIYATLPFLAGALGWFALGERPGAGAMTASLAALAGVALMVGFGAEGGWFGDLLSLGMTVAMAILIAIARRFHGIPTMAAAALSALASAAVALPFAQVTAVTGHEIFLLALFGLVNSALGIALFTLGSRYLPPIETALLGALDAPLAPVWVWLVFSETPGVATLVGGGVVFAAVALHIAREALVKGAPRARPRAEPAPAGKS
jgi:drug/metabolite transporter (DMT)-like permease